MDRQAGLINRAAYSIFWRVVHPLSPTYKYCVYNGVQVNRRILYCHLPFEPGSEYRPNGAQNIDDYESALCDGISRTVRSSDRVVVAGGGMGVTTVYAARAAGPKGHVTVYEASEDRFFDLKKAIDFNDVDCHVETVHGLVGSEVKVYGESTGQRIRPSNLPDCDVLELDCEGAEQQILSNLGIRPRNILVETHGFRGSPTTEVERLLTDFGYAVTDLGVAEPRVKSLCMERDIHVLLAERS